MLNQLNIKQAQQIKELNKILKNKNLLINSLQRSKTQDKANVHSLRYLRQRNVMLSRMKLKMRKKRTFDDCVNELDINEDSKTLILIIARTKR